MSRSSDDPHSGLRPRARPPVRPRARPDGLDATQTVAQDEPLQYPQSDAPLPARVAEIATDANSLDLSQLTLIGVFGPDAALKALVHTPRGKVERVEVGDRLEGGTVTAIGPETLALRKNGYDVMLRMLRS